MKVLYVIAILFLACLIFRAGVFVGFRKANFGHAWSEHYYKNFGRTPNHREFFGEDHFPNANGATGKIIKIELPTIIVQDKDNTEKVVLLKDDTKILNGRQEIKSSDLKMDNFVIIIGTPNTEGQIEAKIIRVLPEPKLLNN